MPKTKVAFVDVKEFEQDYLYNNKPENCNFITTSKTLNNADISQIIDAEILSVFTNSRANADILKQFTNLKLIAARSTGFNHIDLDYCRANSIDVVNVPRYGDCTVAEFTFALLLNVIRKVNLAYQDLQRGIINVQGYMGLDLINKTIGIIGTGAIGCHAVKIAKGFGMKILCYDPYPKSEMIENYNVNYVTLNELYEKADIISIHAPSTKENFHLINDEAFNKMKKGVIIINTARGEIIDTEALYRAIKNNTVAGAGLDVVECEEILGNEDEYLTKVDCIKTECLSKTLINHKMLELPNVIITPHVAFDTKEAVQRILQTTIENINKYLSGNLQNKV